MIEEFETSRLAVESVSYKLECYCYSIFEREEINSVGSLQDFFGENDACTDYIKDRIRYRVLLGMTSLIIVISNYLIRQIIFRFSNFLKLKDYTSQIKIQAKYTFFSQLINVGLILLFLEAQF